MSLLGRLREMGVWWRFETFVDGRDNLQTKVVQDFEKIQGIICVTMILRWRFWPFLRSFDMSEGAMCVETCTAFD